MARINIPEYPFEARRMTPDEGEGWIVTFPDLPGCIATGKTLAEAVRDSQDALKSYVFTSQDAGLPLPQPGQYSGRFNLRTPKSLHAALAARAKAEGVSLNTMAVALLAESLGKHQAAGTD